MIIGRRQFLAGAVGAAAAGRIFANDRLALPASGGGLVLDSGSYANFAPTEKWVQVAPTIAIDSERFGAGKYSLRMTSANGSAAQAEAVVGAPPTRLLQADIYVEQPANCARFDLLLSSNDFAGWIVKLGVNPPLVAGWNRLQLSINDFGIQGSGMTLDDWDRVNKLRFTFISRPGTTATVWVRNVKWLKTRPAITFTWDDGREGCHSHAMPIMLQYGWASTIYVVTEAVDRRSFPFTGGGTMVDALTLDQLKSLQDAGWDIASHSATHPDLTKLTTEQKQYELASAKEWLVKNGFSQGARFFATPYGKRDVETQQIASKYYENLRDASAAPNPGYETPLNLNGLVSTRYSLRFQELPSEGRSTLKQFRTWVDNAIATGTWLIIVGHTVDGEAGWLAPDLFRRYLMYLDSKRDQIDVLTMSQYWDRRNRSLAEFQTE